MVDLKKPVKSVPAPAAAKPAVPATTERRPLPSLSPLPEQKPAAAIVQPGATVGTTATPEKASQLASEPKQPLAGTTEPVKPAVPQNAQVPASQPAKSEEKLGPKIRKRDEILKALRAGAKVEKIDGLYRIVHPDNRKSATSKRRILSLQNQKLLVASTDGKTLTLDAEADKKAQGPKTVVAPQAAAKPEAK